MNLFISFHGGTDPGNVNNILTYDLSESNPIGTPILPNTPKLQELRGFKFRGDQLYVVNAYKKLSQLLQYQQNASGSYQPVGDGILASNASINSIYHPYDLTIDENGTIYLSSQDTNVVTRMNEEGQAESTASYLSDTYPNGNFMAGTFIASAIGDLPAVTEQGLTPPENVSSPQGLSVSQDPTTGRVLNSVRDVLTYEGYLYVSDEVNNSVNCYSLQTGELEGYIARGKMEAPVQLLVYDGKLYIGAGKSVFKYSIRKYGAPSGKAKPKKFIYKELDHVSGMAFDSNEDFYVAERKARKVLKYSHKGKSKATVLDNLPDNPEFIAFY